MIKKIKIVGGGMIKIYNFAGLFRNSDFETLTYIFNSDFVSLSSCNGFRSRNRGGKREQRIICS